MMKEMLKVMMKLKWKNINKMKSYQIMKILIILKFMHPKQNNIKMRIELMKLKEEKKKALKRKFF